MGFGTIGRAIRSITGNFLTTRKIILTKFQGGAISETVAFQGKFFGARGAFDGSPGFCDEC